ncbi:hypothetical protein LMG26845_04949 [Achromobacter insuavis]|uniref:Uncharacterized protein n=1 Tax=Achromobacter insuavis TaxID=1287735 RepID=A0A6J5B812_9BURK|nr:hypothetical protein LMG26845_04949 [Achromobacter insuavis]CUJ49090.1 Uncharacterised protein [Achromobacter sp. 2789STDY5608628]CUK13331.1 Uncharacterised protein [Achromobacter sp. 2789STDY5608615]
MIWYEYTPKARSRTMPNSLSRSVTGWAVPQRRPSCRRVLKKITSDLKGDSNSLSQFFRYVSTGRVWVVSLYMPGPNTSATLPSLTNTAICDSRTVRLAPYWISKSCIG